MSPLNLMIKKNGDLIVYLDKLIDLDESLSLENLKKTKSLCYEKYKIKNAKKIIKELENLSIQ